MRNALKTTDKRQLTFDFLSFFSTKKETPPSLVNVPSIGLPPVGAVPVGAVSVRTIVLEDATLSYVLTRSRRRSVGLTIDGAALRVTAPHSSSISAIEGVIRAKASWIQKKINEQRVYSVGLNWQEGSTVPVLGRPLVLRLRADADVVGIVGIAEDEFEIDLPPHASAQQIKDRAQAWLQQYAKVFFAQKLKALLALHDLAMAGFELTAARTYWGVCTTDRRIRLNWRLIHLPENLIDYVIAHEVAHLSEMNHSARFWQVVARLNPHYIEHRAALKKIRITAYE